MEAASAPDAAEGARSLCDRQADDVFCGSGILPRSSWQKTPPAELHLAAGMMAQRSITRLSGCGEASVNNGLIIIKTLSENPS
jgi:hypothetical protein